MAASQPQLHAVQAVKRTERSDTRLRPSCAVVKAAGDGPLYTYMAVLTPRCQALTVSRLPAPTALQAAEGARQLLCTQGAGRRRHCQLLLVCMLLHTVQAADIRPLLPCWVLQDSNCQGLMPTSALF